MFIEQIETNINSERQHRYCVYAITCNDVKTFKNQEYMERGCVAQQPVITYIILNYFEVLSTGKALIQMIMCYYMRVPV